MGLFYVTLTAEQATHWESFDSPTKGGCLKKIGSSPENFPVSQDLYVIDTSSSAFASFQSHLKSDAERHWIKAQAYASDRDLRAIYIALGKPGYHGDSVKFSLSAYGGTTKFLKWILPELKLNQGVYASVDPAKKVDRLSVEIPNDPQKWTPRLRNGLFYFFSWMHFTTKGDAQKIISQFNCEYLNLYLFLKPIVDRSRGKLERNSALAYKDLFIDIGRKHGISPARLAGHMQAETRATPGAISFAYAMGPMQFMPHTAARFGLQDPFDPAQSIDAAARYLKEMDLQFAQAVNARPMSERARRDYALKLAAAGYNAGEHRVVSAGYRVPKIEETQNYVSNVLNYTRQFRSDFGEPV